MIIFNKNLIKRNEVSKACSVCTTRCCNHMPGIVYPIQFKNKKPTVKSILSLLNNNYCVDWYDGDVRFAIDYKLVGFEPLEKVYYIRPRTTSKPNDVIDPSYGGTCIFLTDTGCSKSFNQRPIECQNLIPRKKPGENCKGANKAYTGKVSAALAWLEYQDLIKKTLEMYESNNQNT